MSEDIENIHGSADAEIHFVTKSSGAESENFQTGDSYIPSTPFKPALPKINPICEQKHKNSLSEEGLPFPNAIAPATSGSSKFCQNHNSAQARNLKAKSGSVPPMDHFEAEPSPPKQARPSNLGRKTGLEPDGNYSGPHPMYDLNSPPTASTEAFTSQNIPSQFTPITSVRGRKARYRNIRSLSLDGKIKHVQNDEGDETEETHNSNETGNPETELNKTPERKPKRKKHRPKVVVKQEKPKTAPKPVTAKPEKPMVKRKYVCRNKVTQTPKTSAGEVSNANDNLKTAAPILEKSCKRALNFDLGVEVREEKDVYSESQAQNFSSRVETRSKVQVGRGIEIVLKKTQVGDAYDLNTSVNEVLKDYISAPEIQAIYFQTPQKSYPLEREMVGNVLHGQSRGQCQTSFLNGTHNKQGSRTITMEGNENQTTPSCENRKGKRTRGSKRRKLQNQEDQNVNFPEMFTQNSYNGNGFPGVHFPKIYKRRRTTKINRETISQGVDSHLDCQEKEVSLKCELGADQSVKIKGKRLKVQTRERDFTSLMGMVVCGQFPTSAKEAAPIFGEMQELGSSKQCLKGKEATSTETNATVGKKRRNRRRNFTACTSITETNATVGKKKRNRRRNFTTCTSTGVLKVKHSSVQEITELMKNLVINTERNQVRKQQKTEPVPINFQSEGQNALVLYQIDGKLVPFEGPFDPVKKPKPRPKVDIDEETDRVWRLLLEDINSEGINGTDEEKEKWWERERGVFRGRADSFIARMHLVQGDRRFSPWKGSVLDSVVGVFLTQNVADHISSSAFMSLAARYPLHSKSNTNPSSDEGSSTASKEPGVCILDLEETTNCQGENSHYVATEKDNENISPRSSSSSKRLTGNTKRNLLGIFGRGLQIDNRTIADREAHELKESMESSAGEKEMDDCVLSSMVHEQAKADPSGPGPNSNNTILPSFMEFLRVAESSHGSTVCEKARVGSFEITEAEGISSNNPSKCEEISTSEQRGVTEESAIHLMFPENVAGSNIETSHLCSSGQVDINISETVLIGNQNNKVLPERESSNVVNIKKSSKHKKVESRLKEMNVSSSRSSKKKAKTGKQKESTSHWDYLRKEAKAGGKIKERTANTMDSLDWEAVRCAHVDEIADTIKDRGMNNKLAERIQDFLNRLVEDHGSTDLEWLRDVPPDKAKEYLLSVRGLGLKSVECVRLLTLHHLAFPVDTNVGRVAVRLGWVPLQPLPESLQLHLLELYPVQESIQKYLWPRLCKLDQKTLYELHYQLITFGKVFCTKSKPNCNACPMRGDCRHFASAFASARLALPAPEEESIVSATEKKTAYQNPMGTVQQLQLPQPQCPEIHSGGNCEPIIEVPMSPEPTIEVPATPNFEQPAEIPDIEDSFWRDPNEIPLIKLNILEFAQNLEKYMHQNMDLQEAEVSKALVALTPEAASIPTPKLKKVSGLRTEHQVYELPDSHPLLQGLDKRELDDPCPYLLSIWTPGEAADSIQQREGKCSAQEFGGLCDDLTCFSCNSIREDNSRIVRGTLLIPCRTAMRGVFPLNGTYFQVNEVFADHASSLNPIDVPRAWIWNLPRCTVYFGTSISTIFKGRSTESIQHSFWKGYVCVRAFDRKSRAPRPLKARLHFAASKRRRTRQSMPNSKQE